jgi:predicted RNA-binding Zn ribbon-like protein
MHAAPSAAGIIGREVLAAAARASSLPVTTVAAYGPDMAATIGEPPARSQSSFGPDLLEALAACTELINTARANPADTAPVQPAGAAPVQPGGAARVQPDDTLNDVAAIHALASRYAFQGTPATEADVPLLRAHRTRLDAAATACDEGRESDAIEILNALLAETGAVPQIVSHHGRGPHIHVSRPSAPMADRMAAHFAMALAELVVMGESARVRSCASPTCRDVFVDLSRNRSRRYCDSRTCGNRLHVAAYRARRRA